jgi:tetratricopeptide (TPR) repeat protein
MRRISFLTLCLLLFATCNAQDGNQYIRLGLMKLNVQDYQRAISLLDHAIKLDSNNAQAYYLRGKSKLHSQRTGDALDDLSIAVNFDSIQAGTPIRIYQQQRAAIKTYNSVNVKYEVHNNVTKIHMKTIEDSKVLEQAEKNGGIIADGNSEHARRFNLPQEGRFSKSFK